MRNKQLMLHDGMNSFAVGRFVLYNPCGTQGLSDAFSVRRAAGHRAFTAKEFIPSLAPRGNGESGGIPAPVYPVRESLLTYRTLKTRAASFLSPVAPIS